METCLRGGGGRALNSQSGGKKQRTVTQLGWSKQALLTAQSTLELQTRPRVRVYGLTNKVQKNLTQEIELVK